MAEKSEDRGSAARNAESAGEDGNAFVTDFFRYRHYVFYPLLILAVIALGLWNYFNVRGVSRESEIRKVRLTEEVSRIVAGRDSELLRMVATPLVWAVRAPMIKENYDQIDQYLVTFVKENNVRMVVVADRNGRVLVSTDKKMEGAKLTKYFEKGVMGTDAPEVTAMKNGDLLVAAPIMGFASRMGTLVLVYAPEKVELGTDSPPGKPAEKKEEPR